MCDRLSSLPDSLLLHILSFLPTKGAVAASFLSKRWRPLGHSFSTLVIHDKYFSGHDAFIQFVDYVLISGDLEFLKSFGLNCSTYNMPNDKINNWIDVLINSRVVHLEIEISLGFYTKLPSSIFNWSTIRVLKLNQVTFSTLSSVNLPSLKVLHLDMVTLPDINFLAMLLFGCALLEMLVLTNLHMSNFGLIQGIKRFNHLVAADVPPSLVPMKALSNVTFLRLRGIWSPSGKNAMRALDGDNTPTFVNLTHLECCGDGTAIVNYLRNFPKLQNLEIIPFLSAPTEQILHVPLCLSSHLKEFTFGASRSNNDVAVMKFILNNAQVLSIVKITRGFFGSCEEEILEMIKEISLYPRASENCNFLHVNNTISSLNDWIAGSGFDVDWSVGLLKDVM